MDLLSKLIFTQWSFVNGRHVIQSTSTSPVVDNRRCTVAVVILWVQKVNEAAVQDKQHSDERHDVEGKDLCWFGPCLNYSNPAIRFDCYQCARRHSVVYRWLDQVALYWLPSSQWTRELKTNNIIIPKCVSLQSICEGGSTIPISRVFFNSCLPTESD